MASFCTEHTLKISNTCFERVSCWLEFQDDAKRESKTNLASFSHMFDGEHPNPLKPLIDKWVQSILSIQIFSFGLTG